MKVSRGQLKDIVKECLLEILSEGLGGQQELTEAVTRRRPQVEPVNQRAKNAQNISHERRSNEALIKKVQSQVSSLSSDPIMASIFADTAATTLPAMLDSDSNPRQMTEGTDAASRIVAASDPAELFGEEMAGKWSDLAFTGAPSKNR